MALKSNSLHKISIYRDFLTDAHVHQAVSHNRNRNNRSFVAKWVEYNSDTALEGSMIVMVGTHTKIEPTWYSDFMQFRQKHQRNTLNWSLSMRAYFKKKNLFEELF